MLERSVPPVPSKQKQKAPYAKYAFLNPYNLSLMAGLAVTAAATGHVWIALGAAATEALWMLFAPDSTMLQRLWFNRMYSAELEEKARLRLEKKFQTLPQAEQNRALALRVQQAQAFKVAAENPAFTVELLRNDLKKLESIMEDYVDIAVGASRCEEHLRTFDIGSVERDIHGYKSSLDKLKPGDERRTVAQKNLDVLLARRQRHQDLMRTAQSARGQMDLVENTFRLLCDDIMSMSSVGELTQRVDELRSEMDTVRATARAIEDEAIEEEAIETEAAAKVRAR